MITTKERIKQKLVIQQTGWDATLDSQIKGVQSFLEGQMGRTLLQKTHVEYHSDGQVFLNNSPVTAIAEVAEYDGESFVAKETTPRFNRTGEMDYEAPTGFDMARITYTAGWTVDWENEGEAHTLPYDIAELADRLVIRQYRKMEHEGEKTISRQDSTVTWGEFLQKEDIKIINQYRRFWI